MGQENQYQELGISSDKKGVHKAIKNLNKGIFPHAFCKIYPDTLTRSRKHGIIGHADGVGTKASLAYMYWKETGDISALANLAIDALVMNLDDMICVGATGPFTFTQNIDRNSVRIPDEAIAAIIACTDEFIAMLKEQGIDITLNGGETADVNDLVRTLTVNASMTTRIKKTDVIDTNIQAGHAIVGLASFGQASYEKEYNSGIGSNGLTMARHKLFSPNYKSKYPETFEETIAHIAYTGSYSLKAMVNGQHLGKQVLSPTRTYAPLIKQLLAYLPHSAISAMIHCSGGGQTKCMNFGSNVHIIKDNLFDIPPLFSLIQKESKEDWKNMYKTFNMGHRFEIYCDDDVAHKIEVIAGDFNIQSKIVGYVNDSTETKLTIKSPHGTFEYKK